MPIRDNLERVKLAISQAETMSQRPHGAVKLLAVSKGQTEKAIEEAYMLNQHDFGESYLQEALTKITALSQYPITWHFIGPIQSNKTKMIAEHFSWVHSISRFKIAQLLNDLRPATMKPLQVCIQVNLTGEATKSGIPAEEVANLATAISQLPRLTLRGLMLIPPPLKDPKEHYALFLSLRNLMHALNNTLQFNMDTLSMGMSEDLIPAIEAGSTIVRVGRGIFSNNDYN